MTGGPRVELNGKRAPELLDQCSLSLDETEKALSDLDRVTEWTWGLQPVVGTLAPRLLTGTTAPWILDLGTGSGFVPSALAQQIGLLGIRPRFIGVDRKLSHLLFGRKVGHHLLPVVADAGALPFSDRAVQWSMSTLFFHHFDAPENQTILSEMHRVASEGTVVVDLRRSHLAAFLLRIVLPILGVGSIARADGRLSLLQGWTIKEVRNLLRDRQISELRRRFPFRFSLVLLAEPEQTV